MNETLIADRLSTVEDLPALPETAMALLQMLGDPDIEVDAINRTLSRDPELSAAVLRIANSPYYALRNKVTGLHLVLSILGHRAVRNIVLTAATATVFARKNRTPQFDSHAFTAHSLAVAATCRFLARFSRDTSPDMAFSVGLLHDIGKLTMDQCLPEEYTASVERARELHVPIQVAERAVWGCDHAAVGALIARKWGLSKDFCDAIAYHHDMKNTPCPKLTASCCMADYVAAVKSLTTPDRFTPPEMDRDAWSHLRLDSRILPDLLAILDPEIEQASQMFHATSTPDVPPHNALPPFDL
jgi:putative nucleotidyltransferase with HDIG domain